MATNVIESSMLVTSSSAFVKEASPDAVWKVWSDVPNWPKWDHNFKETKLEGSFAVNGIITIFHKHFPNPTVLRICHVLENRIFDTESKLNFGHVTVKREAVSQQDGVKITHAFYLIPKDEQMKEMFEKNIAPNVRRDFENAVKNIAELVSKV